MNARGDRPTLASTVDDAPQRFPTAADAIDKISRERDPHDLSRVDLISESVDRAVQLRERWMSGSYWIREHFATQEERRGNASSEAGHHLVERLPELWPAAEEADECEGVERLLKGGVGFLGTASMLGDRAHQEAMGRIHIALPVDQEVRRRHRSFQRTGEFGSEAASVGEQVVGGFEIAGDICADVRGQSETPGAVASIGAQLGATNQCAHRAHAVGPPQQSVGCVLEQRGDLLVLSSGGVREMPHMPVPLIDPHVGQRLMGRPLVDHRGQFHHRRADQRVPERQAVRRSIQKREPGFLRRGQIVKPLLGTAHRLQQTSIACTVERDEQQQPT